MARLFALLLFVATGTQAQDTIYYDEHWGRTSDATEYTFYRIQTKDGKHLRVTDYYMDGVIQMKGAFLLGTDSLKDGSFKYYSETGVLLWDHLYANGKPEGDWLYYYDSGEKESERRYVNGRLEGESNDYYKSGVLKRKEIYRDSMVVRGNSYTRTGKDTTYFPYEQMPRYPGGTDELLRFLSKETVYPSKAWRRRIEGEVILQFILDATGSVTDVKVVQGAHPLLDAEAVRVVRTMPRWEAGRLDGEPISVYFRLPITFKRN